MRRITHRTLPLACPSCEAAGVVKFTANAGAFITPLNAHTRFADVSPLGEDGKPMLSRGEVLRSGKYQPYDPSALPRAQRESAARRKQRSAVNGQRALESAYRIQQDNGRVRRTRERDAVTVRS